MKKVVLLLFVFLSLTTIAQELYNDSTYFVAGAGWLWTYSGKEYVLERNSQKQVIEKVSYSKTLETDFALEYKTVYSYYPDGITLESMTEYVWNSDSVMWKQSAYYDYREDGQTNGYYKKHFDFETNVFTHGFRYIKYYDGDDLSQRFYDTLNVFNDSWNMVQKESYTYLSPGELAERITENYDGVNWYNYSRMANNYAGYNIPVQQFYYAWNSSSEVWEYTSRLSYTPNAADEISAMFYQTWNGSGWDDVFRYDYEYIGDTLKASEIYQTWNGTDYVRQHRKLWKYNDVFQEDTILIESPLGTDEWQNNKIIRFIYDENDHLTSRIEDYWEFGEWQDDIRYFAEYDEFGNKIYEFQHKFVGNEMYDWENEWAVEYYWIEYDPTQIAQADKVTFDCFPNPTTDFVHVVSQGKHQYALYDLSGRCLNQGEFTHSTLISLRDMPNGMYVLSVDGQTNTQIIKQ
jgi:hypothetical protein